MPGNNQAKENIQDRPSAQGTLRAVLELSDQQKRQMGYAHLIGIPSEYLRTILDVDTIRRRSPYLRTGRASSIIPPILKRIASEGAPTRQRDAGALFWCFRVWRDFQPPALSSDDLQRAPSPFPGVPLHRGFTPDSLSYRALASWACRHSTPQYEIFSICCEVCDEVQRVGSARSYSFPCPETAAWIHWASTAFGRDIPIPDQEMGTTAEHSHRWQEMGFRSDHAEALVTLMPEVWFET